MRYEAVSCIPLGCIEGQATQGDLCFKILEVSGLFCPYLYSGHKSSIGQPMIPCTNVHIIKAPVQTVSYTLGELNLGSLWQLS